MAGPARRATSRPDAARAPLEAARRSGLIVSGAPLVVMLSGGADSTCLLDVAIELGARVHALHVDHGLRAGSDDDARHCRRLCEERGVPIEVERVALPARGNVQANAREARYVAAEALAAGLRCDYATAHTLSDQAETVLYRLATSPGRRALVGMAPRRGRLVRPLLDASRVETVSWCRARGVAWLTDSSNADPRFSRTRVREEVMPVLRDFAPAAERVIAETARRLRDEGEVLDRVAEKALGGGGAVAGPDLAEHPPAVRRLALRRLAEDASNGTVALTAAQAERVLALAGRGGGSGSLDVGGGLRAVVEYGTIRFSREDASAAAEPVTLAVPGRVAFGEWEVEARILDTGAPVAPSDEALLAGAALGRAPCVRAWRAGDRMRPAGLGGTKSLQDLFVDAKVPRELRSALPVLEVDGEVAWVAGVATGERFRAAPGAPGAVALAARRRAPERA